MATLGLSGLLACADADDPGETTGVQEVVAEERLVVAGPPIQATQLLVAIEGGGAALLHPQTGGITARANTGADAFGALLSADGKRGFVTDKTGGTLSEVDPSSGAVRWTIPVGSFPQQPALSADGRLFIPMSGEASIAVIDVSSASPAVLRRLPTGEGTKPHIVALSPDGRRLWATVQGKDPKVVSFEISAGAEGSMTEVRYDLVPRVIAASNEGAFFTAHHSTGLHYIRADKMVATTPYLDENGSFSEPRKQIEGVATSADGRLVTLTHEGRRALVVLKFDEAGIASRLRNIQGLSANPYWTTLDPSGAVAYVSVPGSGTVSAYSLAEPSSAPPLWVSHVGGKVKRMAVTTGR